MIDAAAAPDPLYRQALSAYRVGRVEEARSLCEQALNSRPGAFDPLHLLGIIALQMQDSERAVELIGRAIAINPRSAPAHNHLGSALLALGRCEAAIACCDRSIALEPEYAEAHYNRGNALFDLTRYEQAIESYRNAIEFKAEHALAHNNQGLAWWRLGRHDAAIACYEKAIAIQPTNAEAYNNRGHALRDLRRFLAAIDSYDTAIELRRDYAEAHNGRGSALAGLKQYQGALQSYDRAIAVHPVFAEAHLNRGNVLHELGQSARALINYDAAIGLNPRLAQAYCQRGESLRIMGEFEAAVASLDLAFSLEPDLKFIRGLRRHLKMRLCDWRDFDTDVQQIMAGIERGAAVCAPFPLLALSDSAALQRSAARIYVREECPPDPSLPVIPRRPRRGKIRIGYISPDFRNHPVSLLLADVIETHDRSAFELWALSIGPASSGEIASRLRKAFDRFIQVNAHSDLEIALLCRTSELDIAVDLGGFTAGCRPTIFALRVAPLQVSYLGYLGTMANSCIDYLIADAITVPPETRAHYSEKILYLPSYQANDSKRRVADKVFSRAELGLSDSSFVFCCTNTSYKITPATFAGWMRILGRVRNGVLYLCADLPIIEINLRREAARLGVDPGRLIFGKALPNPEYLARYRAMDLFLDTSPYNGGATASDALWAGLPVLTCRGEAFASRMAASLLTAIGMPELIASTQPRYEELAVEFATVPGRLADIKQRLAEHRPTALLFDTRQFTQQLEAGYRQIHARYQAGLPAEDTYAGLDSPGVNSLREAP